MTYDTLMLLERFRPETDAVMRYAQHIGRTPETTAIVVVLREYAQHDKFVASLTSRHERAWRCDGGVVFPCARGFARSSVCAIANESDARGTEAADLERYFDETPRGFAIVVFLGARIQLARLRAQPVVRATA